MYGATLKRELIAVGTTPEQFDVRLGLQPGTTKRWLIGLVPDRRVPTVEAGILLIRQEQNLASGASAI
ncbi:MAG: hypothetical protein ACYDCQ_15020 [Dehalococcoidia bacterium]